MQPKINLHEKKSQSNNKSIQCITENRLKKKENGIAEQEYGEKAAGFQECLESSKEELLIWEVRRFCCGVDELQLRCHRHCFCGRSCGSAVAMELGKEVP